jgi:hypothetical protein
VGGRTFEWVNLPGSLNNRWGLSLTGGSASGLVSTANSALPNAGATRDLALGSAMFWWSGPGLITSNQLARQSFSGLGGLSFGDPGASGGAAVALRLLVHFLALPTGSTEPGQHVNAQNADGYFTGVTVAVPEAGAANGTDAAALPRAGGRGRES